MKVLMLLRGKKRNTPTGLQEGRPNIRVYNTNIITEQTDLQVLHETDHNKKGKKSS